MAIRSTPAGRLDAGGYGRQDACRYVASRSEGDDG